MPDRRREAPVAFVTKSVPRCHRSLPPRPCRSGSCLPVSTPSTHRPTSAPSAWEQREASRLLEDLAAAMDARWRRRRDRRVFPRHHAVHRGRAAAIARCRSHASRACLRSGRRPPAPDDAHHPVLRPPRPRCRRRAASRTSACWPPSAPGRAAMPGRGCRCGKPMKRSSEAHVRNAGRDRASHRSATTRRRRKRGSSRCATTCLRRCGISTPPSAARLADFLLDRCHVVLVSTTGIDRAHRMFTVLNATRQAARTQRHPEGRPARRRAARGACSDATRIWDRAESRLGDEFESLFSHIRTMHARSSPPGHLRHPQHRRRGRRGPGLHRADTAAGRRHLRRHPQVAARRIGAFAPAISSLADLSGLAEGAQRLDAAGDAVVAWQGQGPRANSPGSSARSIAWPTACASWASAAKRRASRFGAVVHAIRDGRDLQAPASPLDLARDELRTIHHNLRDLHARSAPMAKLVLLRLNDHMAGSPQRRAVRRSDGRASAAAQAGHQ